MAHNNQFDFQKGGQCGHNQISFFFQTKAAIIGLFNIYVLLFEGNIPHVIGRKANTADQVLPFARINIFNSNFRDREPDLNPEFYG